MSAIKYESISFEYPEMELSVKMFLVTSIQEARKELDLPYDDEVELCYGETDLEKDVIRIFINLENHNLSKPNDIEKTILHEAIHAVNMLHYAVSSKLYLDPGYDEFYVRQVSTLQINLLNVYKEYIEKEILN